MGPDAATAARLLRGRARDGLWLAVDGTSMGASLPGPARVRVVHDGRAPRLLEVWAYVSDVGQLTVHRVAGRRRGRVVLVGDGNAARDPLVRHGQLVGRVEHVEPPGGPVRAVGRRRGVFPLVRWGLRAAWRRSRSVTDAARTVVEHRFRT